MRRLRRGDQPPDVRSRRLPGRRSREYSRRLAELEAPGSNTLPAGSATLVWQEALGVNVLDVDGNRYLDFTSGFGAAAIGHRHPRVLAAVERQATRLVHGLGDVAAHPERIELAAALVERAPLSRPAVHFAISGADAVEVALKTALLATGRRRIAAFDPSYHGTTLGALALTSRPAFRDPFAAWLSPHVDRHPHGGDLEPLAGQLSAGATAAVIVEPVVGREGVRPPPPGWLAELAGLCEHTGTLLIADEVLTGCGRTGCFFAVEAEGVEPDLLCCGKALGGGLPIAAVLGGSELLATWEPGAGGEALHTATFLAHPLACAAARATLEVIEDEGLVDRAAALGARLGPLLSSWPGRLPGVTAARGRGLLWGIELDDPARAATAAAAARDRGLLLLAGGAVLELCPPLSISEELLALGCDILSEALAAIDG